MHFTAGASTITLAGGRTYHWIIPSEEGDHPIHWFIHDPQALFDHGVHCKIPFQWIHNALAGLERVNPFIHKLEKMAIFDEDNEMALQIYQPDSVTTNEIVAMITLAPAACLKHREIVIKPIGEPDHHFLDPLSPLIEPLHYVMLLPYGTTGWSVHMLNAHGKPFSQSHWYRTCFFMNAEQMSYFSRLTGISSLFSCHSF
jgi:hypothetical protein